jgi:hypothetical protein
MSNSTYQHRLFRRLLAVTQLLLGLVLLVLEILSRLLDLLK